MLNPSMAILAQVNLEGFEQAAQQNTLFAVLVSIILILLAVVIILFKRYEDKNKELKENEKKFGVTVNEIRKEQGEKLDSVREEHATQLQTLNKEHGDKLLAMTKEHNDKLDIIRKEQLLLEEKRNEQTSQNQKETLNVLNGVSNILETSEKIVQIDNKSFMDKLKEISEAIVNLTNKIDGIETIKKK